MSITRRNLGLYASKFKQLRFYEYERRNYFLQSFELICFYIYTYLNLIFYMLEVAAARAKGVKEGYVLRPKKKKRKKQKKKNRTGEDQVHSM